MSNPVLETVRKGGSAAGLWLVSGSPSVAELAAEARPDALIFHCQHGLWGSGALHAAIGVPAALATPLVPVAQNSPIALGSAPHAGARPGLVAPVETTEQAR